MHPSTNPNPPVTQASTAILTATHHSLDSYHLPSELHLLPFSTPCSDPYISSRMRPLYIDRDQTQRHHAHFFFAKSRIPRQDLDSANLPLANAACDLAQIYGHVLNLYDHWSLYISEIGAQRISLWAQWYEESHKSTDIRNERFVGACASTLTFLEEDHEKRKLEFVTEVYALLEGRDAENANMVLEDLAQIWPGVTINQVQVLEEYVVDYAHVPRRRGFVKRRSD